MSIKDLFGRNYLPDKNEKELAADAESGRNISAIKTKQDAFVPQIDYANPDTFAKYGSATLYYKSALDRILNYYPYDGSDEEINSFHNRSLDIEKYIFENKYPRTTGYITLSPASTTTSTKLEGYGVPDVAEYITFNGGPNVLNETQPLSQVVPNTSNNKFQYNNVYDDNLYTNNGYPSDYGAGTRLSNLRSDFDTGVTVEFWAKTGSIATSDTDRQIIFDAWNNNLSSSADESYGRLRIELNVDPGGTSSPFLITVQSGTLSASAQQINTASIGVNTLSSSLENWGHYAFVFQNSGSSFQAKLYVNGELNDTKTYTSTTIGDLTSRNMQGRLGGLLTAPSYLADSTLADTYAGAGKLSGSLDEFRFWKTARNAEQIGRNWFDQIRGGTNTDISNTTLGMYYKFNEGITQTASVDSVVLDFGGRLCNGSWTGYSVASRNTGSAIVSASASEAEYLDPIIYSNHPRVLSLRSELNDVGSYHDGQNTGQFINLIPSWVVEEAEEANNADGTSDLEQLAHIMGAYFDKLYLQISALPSFRHAQHTSASHKPLPFAQHLPESLGLITPEIFVDSEVLEKFKNRTDSEIFQGELNETKNLIYQNLYNSLSTIYKSKGTHRSIRNIMRCFNIDDNLIYFNTYANNQTYELNNNLKQVLKKRKTLNFNTASSLHAVMYQAADPRYADSLGYITGSGADFGYEDTYGLTTEASIRFPRFFKSANSVDRNFITSSLFGMQTAFTASTGTGYAGGTTSLTGAQDVANFQVFAIRDELGSKNVRFMLTSSYDPHPFNALTSSTFMSVYANEDWNLSVALRPTNYPYAGVLSGSDDYSYDVVFRGFNNTLGTIRNSFEVSASIAKAVGQDMLRSWKRLYVGAQNTNLTGSNLIQADTEVNGLKHWTQYVDNISLKQHALDRENSGISGSYQNISALDSRSTTHDIYNFNSLALDWHFGEITSSDAGGNFYASDISSGSALVRDNFGWAGEIGGYIYPGKGHGFAPSSDDVVTNELMNEFKFIDPEIVTSDDMVKILSEDDELFGLFDEIPSYFHTIEKSLYAAISEEILDYFAGVLDFNNVIGDPVNRYRSEYKPIELLRRIYFEKFNNVKTVEKFTEYFRWFDDAIANIIQQVIPASAEFTSDMYNTVESHVLERNKYQSQFPTIEFSTVEPTSPIRGVGAFLLTYQTDLFGGVEASPRPTNIHKNYWKKRAQPGAQGVGSYEISSGDATVDAQRVVFRNIKWSKPSLSGSQVILSKADGTQYEKNNLLDSQLDGVTSLRNPEFSRTIKGGVNFEPGKSFSYVQTSVYPAGPVNTADGVFIPENVLYADIADFTAIESKAQWDEEGNVSKKRHRYIGVTQGRDYDGGFNYTKTKSSFSYPFNIISASISGGADNWISNRLSSSVTITNLHNDVYGTDLEKPMQGPFTEYAVGGHQSRHVKLNTSASNKTFFAAGLDNYTTRPEAWKLLLGKLGTCPTGEALSGAMGLVSADYPWPEANAVGAIPYPMTASQKAVYYRDFVAKRPVNIRNIQMRTGSTILGNWQKKYEVVHSFDTYANPRNFIEQQPVLPAQVFQNNSTSSTQTRTFLDTHRSQEEHFEFVGEYNIGYLTAAVNDSIINSRFSTVGGMLTDGTGYRDFRSDSYSVYNSLGKRYMAVIKPSQGPSGSISEPSGSGTPGIRVNDIHGQDFGLTSHYARHTARFGRDSLQVTGTTAATNGPGASYDQLPGFHKTHRNNICQKKAISCDLTPSYSGSSLDNTVAMYWIETPTTVGPVLASADNVAPGFITSSMRGTEDGLTISAWVYPSSQVANGHIFSVGKAADTGSPFFQLVKSNLDRLEATIHLRDKSNTARVITAYGTSSLLQDTQWHHLACVVSGTNGTLEPSQKANDLLRFYVDGQRLDIVSFTTTPSGAINNYDPVRNADYSFKNFAAIPKTGEQIYSFGGESSATAGGTLGLSGSMDQMSMWTRPLDDNDVLQLYNGGVPCDVTQSAPYLYNPSELFSWYVIGEPSQNESGTTVVDNIKTTNNGVFASGSNAIFDHSPNPKHNMYPVGRFGSAIDTSIIALSSGSADGLYPDPLPGCTAPFVGYTETCTYEDRPLYDNFNIQHQIPRDSRQYAWITASLHSTASWWSCGFTPRDFWFRSGSTYIEPLNFVSASEVASVITSGTRSWESSQYGVYTDPVYQVSRLNLNIYEPITTITSSYEGTGFETLGYPTGTLLIEAAIAAEQYLNTPEFIKARVATTSPQAFNALMFKRGNQYGYPSWKQVRQQDHPILTAQKKSNTLSIGYLGDVTGTFDLPPVSMKGVPVHINMDYANSFSTSLGGLNEQYHNVTLLTTYNNEMVGFNQQALNRFVNVNYDSEVTPFEQLVAMKDRNNIDVNWVLYSENVFPSIRREFISSSMTRVGYDNEFWRDSQAQRVTGGFGATNSVGVNSYEDWGSVTRYLTQSLFALDAPYNFLTRTGPPEITSDLGPFYGQQRYYGSSMLTSNSAGELQNTYSFYHFNVPATASGPILLGGEINQIPLMIRNGGLYSRKHMLNSPISPYPPTISGAVNRQLTGMDANNVLRSNDPSSPGFNTTGSLATGSGEALWQAPTLAGYLTTSNGETGFVGAPSKPWYNDYDEFRQDVKTIAKGYAVVPEFRISERIESYTKVGINGGDNFDAFSIPGTKLSSSQASFYKDYSNSDFMKNFLDVKQMSDLEAKELRLTCRAAIKFNPYKGFYPAQRTLDLVSQFSKSFAGTLSVNYITGGSLVTVTNVAVSQYSMVRPLMQPLFAPGILYNSIKSGMAVDYPIITNGYRSYSQQITGAIGAGSYATFPENWAINSANPTGSTAAGIGTAKYVSGAFWSQRVPFEAIMNPVKYLKNAMIPDIEPHPSVSLQVPITASLTGESPGTLYNAMASNFFAEVGNFFLQDQEYSKLQSDGVNLSTYKFAGDETFGARLRMRTSYDGARTYTYETGEDGTNYFYASDGAQAFFKNSTTASTPPASDIEGVSGSYELPQDPAKNKDFQHNFVMYNRTTAFGPPVSGRQDTSLFGTYAPKLIVSGNYFNLSASSYGVKDSLNGYNWSFTPPYYHGESWVDFIFRPSASVSYDLQRILAETRTVQRRYDPGSDMQGHKKIDGFYRRTLHRDQTDFLTANTGAVGVGAHFPSYGRNFSPYASENINDNAMQIDSCINLFGVENIAREKVDKFGRKISQDNEAVSQRWVIQPKFETPMMNFASGGIRPIAHSAGTLALPEWGSGSVPSGMWHQFGVLPDSPSKGIFMEIGDIPTQWLQNHYEVVTGSSIYNNYTASDGPDTYKSMQSFASLMGFNDVNSSVRMGKVAEKQVIKEAVVAIPYIAKGLSIGEEQPSGANAAQRKQFINIPSKRYKAAIKETDGSVEGDSLSAAGDSIRRLIDTMEDYVLPPQFDFLNNKKVKPIVMYMFEFEYELDQDDLSYIWQNLAPREYQRMELKKESVAHQLMDTELLTEYNLLSNPNLRWMVFKVKQRSQRKYEDMVIAQVGQPARQRELVPPVTTGYNLNYNWPYDFVSIVESIKIDVDVKYEQEQPLVDTMKVETRSTIGKQNQVLSKKKRAKKTITLAKKSIKDTASAKKRITRKTKKTPEDN